MKTESSKIITTPTSSVASIPSQSSSSVAHKALAIQTPEKMSEEERKEEIKKLFGGNIQDEDIVSVEENRSDNITSVQEADLSTSQSVYSEEKLAVKKASVQEVKTVDNTPSVNRMVEKKVYRIQIGCSNTAGATNYFEEKYDVNNVQVNESNGAYKYTIKSFDSKVEAQNYLKNQVHVPGAFVVAYDEKVSVGEQKNGNVMIDGRILNEYGKPLSATVEFNNNKTNEVVASTISDTHTGEYSVCIPSGQDYGMSVVQDDYLFYSKNINVPKKAESFDMINEPVQLKKVTAGSNIVLSNIFYDYGNAFLKKASVNELNRLVKYLNKLPSLRIEISGHTDNVSSAAFNKRLSLKRAKVVVDYLVLNGVNPNRLEYVGHGFDYPIASNKSEKGRAQNRRTEFKIIGK